MDDSLMKTLGDMNSILAEIALENRIITQSQLIKALGDIQSAVDKGMALTFVDYLLERNIVDKKTMTRLLAAAIRSIDKKFAVLAARNHLVSEKDLVKALDIQKDAFKEGVLKSVGDILIDSGRISGEQRNRLMEKLKGFTYAELMAHDDSAVAQPFMSGSENDLKRRISLGVTNNGLRADIHIPGGLGRKPAMEEIKSLIRNQGLKFGVISDPDIQSHLDKYAQEPYSFVVALGIHALPARDAVVRIFFINDYLNPGKITEHGTIDFKDRGAVPYVREGVVLAEKIPGIDGKPGSDVFANLIPAEQANDQPMKSGPGTTFSENGLKIVSTMDGQPLMTVHGEVSVMKELHIQGDVDYTTGNILFNGSIIVKGSVNPGFVIRGGNLTAKDVNGAEIDVAGNIEISGGVINSVLRAGGGVQAMHMAGSKVDAYGDVLVKKAVIDCKIRTSGAFAGESAHVISSLVSAKKGIEAKQIGTDVSSPCTIRTGISDHIEKKIRYFREEIEERKNELGKEQKRKEEYEATQRQLHRKIMDLVQAEDHLGQQKRSLEARLSEADEHKEDQDPKQRKLLEEGLLYCDQELRKMEKRNEEFFKQQDMLTEYILELQSQCEAYVQEIERLNEKIKEVKTWDKKTPALAQIKVRREIVAGTLVNGPNTMMVIRETSKNVTLRETRRSDSEADWEMKIEPS